MATSTSRRAAGAATGSQSAKKPQQPTMSKFRLLLVWAVLVLGQLGIACRLVYLQVIAAPSLQQQARSQQRTSLSPFIPRRAIIDRNGNVLAIDQSVYTLYAHPVQFKDKPEVKDVHEAVALKLAPILGRSPTDLQRLLKSADSGIPVARALSEQVADQIKLLGLDGLELIRQRQRLYPQQGLTSGIIGYVNTEHKGQAGIEYSQQKMLAPALRSAKVSLDAKGHLLPDHIPANLLQTDDLRLQLTLDTQIQQAARAALSQQLQKYRAQRGTVIVMDAQDGSLLALVSEPTFNPNHYYQSDPELFKNWALSDLYEPGSTFKPINVAIALETGAIRADSVFNDEGRISVGGWPIQNNDYADKGAR
ncbi:MAG TPA: penicillin-binding transpeptidase domain-containing protein, partial [Candidatus Caenarcaniphilales bacterium]